MIQSCNTCHSIWNTESFPRGNKDTECPNDECPTQIPGYVGSEEELNRLRLIEKSLVIATQDCNPEEALKNLRELGESLDFTSAGQHLKFREFIGSLNVFLESIKIRD